MGNKGAIILVNCDNDDGKSNAIAVDNRDCADNTINGNNDLPQIGPLDLRKATESPLGSSRVVLSVSTAGPDFQQCIRIFDSRVAGGTEIIGPNTAAEKTFVEADFTDGKIELGMEAVRFPSVDYGFTEEFDGRITLELKVEDNGGLELHSETAIVRVAPFILPNHMDITDTVYVAEIAHGARSANNLRFIPALDAIITPRGVTLEVIPAAENGGDRWAQDIMELGHSSLPNHDLVTCVRTGNERDQAADRFGQYPGRTLLTADMGYHETNIPIENSSLDSFGNLECSPPVPGYPFGRIVYGDLLGATQHLDPMIEEMREFLHGQAIQEPIILNSGWLKVGHVDEFLSFIPDPTSARGFKVAFAAPERALDIVLTEARINELTPLFEGIRINDGSVLPVDAPGLEVYDDLCIAGLIRYDPAFRQLQLDIQDILEVEKDELKAELGLVDADFIDIPILFRSDDPAGPTDCIAFTPGSVNMLVVTTVGNIDLIMPKPFGPVVGGQCRFEEAIEADFAANPLVTTHFVDCFTTYHTLSGEIHCGTNSKRVPPTRKWWH